MGVQERVQRKLIDACEMNSKSNGKSSAQNLGMVMTGKQCGRELRPSETQSAQPAATPSQAHNIPRLAPVTRLQPARPSRTLICSTACSTSPAPAGIKTHVCTEIAKLVASAAKKPTPVVRRPHPRPSASLARVDAHSRRATAYDDGGPQDYHRALPP